MRDHSRKWPTLLPLLFVPEAPTLTTRNGFNIPIIPRQDKPFSLISWDFSKLLNVQQLPGLSWLILKVQPKERLDMFLPTNLGTPLQVSTDTPRCHYFSYGGMWKQCENSFLYFKPLCSLIFVAKGGMVEGMRQRML